MLPPLPTLLPRRYYCCRRLRFDYITLPIDRVAGWLLMIEISPPLCAITDMPFSRHIGCRHASCRFGFRCHHYADIPADAERHAAAAAAIFIFIISFSFISLPPQAAMLPLAPFSSAIGHYCHATDFADSDFMPPAMPIFRHFLRHFRLFSFQLIEASDISLFIIFRHYAWLMA
jgi:hypothetical protein